MIRPEGGRRGAPLLLIASYAEEVEARGPLRAAVVALRAKGLARELVLKPLAPHEMRDVLVERLGADSLPGNFVARMMSELVISSETMRTSSLKMGFSPSLGAIRIV